ncbi:MAG: long-chain-fatty-acid--CoA ligase, partial [Gammaproteobacteria bacterium]
MQNFPELIRWRARVTPEIPALWFEGRTTSYRELDRRSNQVANALIDLGTRPGDRICVLDQNHDEFFEVIFGIAKTGAVFVPVNWRLAPPELGYVLNDSGAKILFVGGPFCQAVQEIQNELKTVEKIISFSTGVPAWENYALMRAAYSEADPEVEIDAGATAWQLYTSGTTGNPKGSELTTSNIFSLFTFAPTLFGGMREGEASLIAMPLYHIGGSGYALVAIVAGNTLVVLREFNPAQALQLIQEQKVRHSFLVPAALLFMLQADSAAPADLSSLRTIAYGAAPMPEDLLRRCMKRFGCEFFQVYGLTETSGAVTRLRFEDHHFSGPHVQRLQSCGQPLFGVDIRVVDEKGRDVPPGEIGEIIIRSAQVMKGYWHAPEATAKTIRNGWFYTGDAGTLDEDGFIYIKDRVKDMIVSGGENIYPAEIEGCLFGHPAVADVAVIGVPDEKWGEAVKAVVVLKQGAKATQEELIDFCKGKIASYKRPKTVDFVTSV